MSKVLSYLKYFGLFFLIMMIIAILSSLINLTGLSSNLINKLSIILTAISFFFISAKASHNTKEKGYILGIKLGVLFVLFLFLINLIFFKSKINIDRLIYYIILISSSILGGSFGKNLKIKKFAR